MDSDSGIVIEFVEANLNNNHLERYFRDLGHLAEPKDKKDEEKLPSSRCRSDIKKTNSLDLEQKYHINIPKTRIRTR